MYQKLMSKINSNPNLKIAVTVTGGGTSAIGEMLRYGGSSSTFLYGYVPYSSEFTTKYLGKKPDKLCSPETSRMLAMRAFWDVLEATQFSSEIFPVGIGSTSALGKITPEREGREHKIFVTVQTKKRTTTYTVILKSPRTREEEETVNEMVILKALELGAGISEKINFTLSSEDLFKIEECNGDKLEHLIDRSKNCFILDKNESKLSFKDLTWNSDTKKKIKLIFPASFNPLHESHKKMAEIASELTGFDCHYELSILNVDKPPVSYIDVNNRVRHFREWDKFIDNSAELIVTGLPTFLEKAQFFGPVIFVVGQDTVERICNPKYYGSYSQMTKALYKMQTEIKCKFICFARQYGDTIKEALTESHSVFNQMATAVDSKYYISNVSSAEKRKNNDG